MGCLLGLALLLPAARSQTFFHLLYHPVVGEVHHYHIDLTFTYADGSMEFLSLLEVKVIKVSPTGEYSVQTVTTNAKIRSGENEKDLPQQPPVISSYSKLGLPRGDSLKDREADPFADLLQHLTEFEAPALAVRIGDNWINHPTGPKNGLFGEPRVSYRLADIFQDGSRHFARIHYAASAGIDPEAATGTLILDHSNNHLYQMQAEIPHFKPEGTTEAADVKVSLRELLPSPVKAGTIGVIPHSGKPELR